MRTTRDFWHSFREERNENFIIMDQGLCAGIGCFLSGMMGITMKYIIDKHIPFLNKINPASMITDGFYALYYYDTLNRYWFDLISLLVLAAILVFVSIIGLRRQKYDNI